MRTFQFSDAKSHKFWTIDVSGSTYTVTYGKVGTAGQSQTKSFASPEKAQAEADKLIREKTGKGYRETTPAATVSQAEAFEKGLVEHRHEVVRWSAYADYLMERGDPRGEFMQVQLALEDESLPPAERKKLQAQEKKLLKAHEKAWLGPLAAFTVDGETQKRYRGSGKQVDLPPVGHTFERGWLGRLEFYNLTVNQARAFAACTDARMIREVVVEGVAYEAPEGTAQQYIESYYAPGPDVPSDVEEHETPALHALCRCPHLQSVRSFRLEEPEEFNCHINGEAAVHLVKQMPLIEELGLHAHRVDANKLFVLPMPHLKSLTLFHSNSYPLEKLAANKTLTNLTTLRCHPHALEYDDDEEGAYIRLKHLRAVCRSPHLTSLTHLCLRLTDFGDDGVAEIVSSGILKRLRVLDLQGGCMSDKGATALAACPDLKNLEFLNLQSNGLTEAGVAALRATKVKAELGRQHGTTARGSDREMPEYLFEGDIE